MITQSDLDLLRKRGAVGFYNYLVNIKYKGSPPHTAHMKAIKDLYDAAWTVGKEGRK